MKPGDEVTIRGVIRSVLRSEHGDMIVVDIGPQHEPVVVKADELLADIANRLPEKTNQWATSSPKQKVRTVERESVWP